MKASETEQEYKKNDKMIFTGRKRAKKKKLTISKSKGHHNVGTILRKYY